MPHDVWLTGDLSVTASRLLDLVLSQQSKDGPHAGEFGDHHDQSEVHQPKTVKDMAGKPRLYMTLWPCRVLRRHGLADEAVMNAIEGVRALFDGGVVPGEESTNPITPRARFVSYRHSLCGALILFEMLGPNPFTSGVLDKMLDWESSWRAGDRGWAHGNAQPGQSDLYTSLYAIELLRDIHGSTEVDPDLAEATIEPLKTSLDYLEQVWEANGWKYGTLESEETFPLVFAQVGEILDEHRRRLFDTIASEILVHRTPAGGMRTAYRARVGKSVSDESCYARLAYAAYRAHHHRGVWRGFAARALAGDIRRLTSAEAAWLLDLELKVGISDK